MVEIRLLTWENESGPGRCVNTNRGLTHHLITAGRGLGSW